MDEGSQEPASCLLTWCGAGSVVGAGLEVQAGEPRWEPGKHSRQPRIMLCGPDE